MFEWQKTKQKKSPHRGQSDHASMNNTTKSTERLSPMCNWECFYTWITAPKLHICLEAWALESKAQKIVERPARPSKQTYPRLWCIHVFINYCIFGVGPKAKEMKAKLSVKRVDGLVTFYRQAVSVSGSTTKGKSPSSQWTEFLITFSSLICQTQIKEQVCCRPSVS